MNEYSATVVASQHLHTQITLVFMYTPPLKWYVPQTEN